MGVYAVNVYQSFFGRMFNDGNVKVDAVGRWDINFNGIRNNLKGLKAYLEQYTVESTNAVKILND